MILSVGSINVDVQMRIDADPTRATTVAATDLEILPGGKAANVALLVARLGVEAALIGCVGDDDLGRLALEGPRSADVDVSGVRRSELTTGVAAIIVEPDGDKTIYMAAAANDDWGCDLDDVQERIASAPDRSVLVIDLEVPQEVVELSIAAGRARGLAIVIDPSPPSRLHSVDLAHVEHVTPDVDEATELTGIDASGTDGARRAAVELRDRGARCAHVKLADGGVALADADGECIVNPPKDLEVVDATGAGDAYAGGLAWALHRGAGSRDAARWAVAASACAVTAYGSQDAYPELSTLERMHQRVRAASTG